MGISTIGSLFASNIDPLLKQQSSEKRDTRGQSPQQVPQSAASTDAVIYSRSSGPAPKSTSATHDARASRIQQIQSQVDSGSYKPDSEKVAVAVLKELA